MKKLAILFITLVMTSSSAEAQFLKNLKKKVEQKVEQKVIDNVSDKAAVETEKSLDKMWNMNLENLPVNMGAERVDPSEIPPSYSFDWEYSMNLETAQGNMDMTYLLKKDAPHFGMKMPNVPNMFMVMDADKEMTVLFMDSGESKMVTATRMNSEIPEDPEMETYQNAEIKEIAPKEIMGYSCKGYQSETPDYIVTFYVTEEAGISYTDIYSSNQENVPKGFDPEWLEKGTGLMMQMNLQDKKDPAKNATMTCTKLEKADFSINKSEYQSF